jgi:membrane-bound lytic murein transglycosylase D
MVVQSCFTLAILVLSACASPTKPTRYPAPLLPGMTAKIEKKPKNSTVTAPASVPGDEDEAADADQDQENAPAADSQSTIEHFEEPSVPTSPDEDEEEVVIRPKKSKNGIATIPHEFNEKVATWIRYFSQRDRERFQMFLDRGEPYREAVENILEENKVPADLYYLGLIESGFNFRAKSRVKAVGVWQFMKPTGKMYGLEVDSYIDERRDPIRATEAAAKYLRDLHREFKSWYLAMAAYNAGPGRIRSSIRKAGTDDFWELVSKRRLPSETMDYIPKYLAARYIGENPDLFAFYINEEKKYPDVELVKVPSPVTFEAVERTSGMPAGTLSFVNPHYLRNHTHPGRKMDEIWVPEKFVTAVNRQVSALSSQRVSVKPERMAVSRGGGKITTYTVKKGDSLKTIARKRGLSVAYLSQVNGLGRSSRILPGQVLKLSATSYRQKKTHPRRMQKRKR